MPLRVHMVFGETSILVPCGDGKFSVAELVEKGIAKFKKFIAKDSEDVVEVRSISCPDGSLVDEEDEVCSVLVDKDTLVLDYKYYPHQDEPTLRDVSVSDDSAIVASQPYSPSNHDNEFTGNHDNEFPVEDSEHPPLSDKDYDTAGTETLNEDATLRGSSSQEHSDWPLGSSQETPNKTPHWTSSTAGREISDPGYNSRSQEGSFGPESQEYNELSLQSSQGNNLPGTPPKVTTSTLASGSSGHSSLKHKSSSREDVKTGGSPSGSKTSLSSKHMDQRYIDRRADSMPAGSGRGFDYHTPMDIPGNYRHRNYPMYPGGRWADGRGYTLPSSYDEHRFYPPAPYDYPGYPRVPRYGYDNYRPNQRPVDFYGKRRDYQVPRTLSTERLEQFERGRPFDYPPPQTDGYMDFLSQPTTQLAPSYLPGYDPRFAVGGPSPGVILSQPPKFAMYENNGRGNLKRGRGISIEDLDEADEMPGPGGPSPFRRDTRKTMSRDGNAYSEWMNHIYENGIQDDEANDVPVYDASQSQRSRSPSPTPRSEPEDSSDEEDPEFGNIHIVELHKGAEPMGVYLTHYTSPDGRDLGVFIRDMNPTGFAAQSGKLQHQDRILACNGVDFTKELTNARVEEIFNQMSQEPLLRLAISRGVPNNIPYTSSGSHDQEGVVTEERATEEAVESSAPKIVSNPSQPPSLSLTNTRQIGVKHTIQLTKDSKTNSLGFGVTSRDVMTDTQSVPFYIKSITSGTPAFNDGRLKIGDRLLEVNGTAVTGLSRPEVVSRQEIVDEQDQEDFPSSPRVPTAPTDATATTVGKTVLTLTIPLSQSGSAGLGVTVYGRTTLGAGKKAGDMGIYVKSIVPGGAAALDGRLRKNDQLLCVNKEGLLGSSNQHALDKLRTILSKGRAESVELVVARRVHNPGSSLSPSMAALGEEPEEDEKTEDKGREVGIDIGSHDPTPKSHDMAPKSHDSAQVSHDTGKIGRLISQTSLNDTDSKPTSKTRSRAVTVAGGSPRIKRHEPTSPRTTSLKRAEESLGSGDFDHLLPRSPKSPGHAHRMDLEHSTEIPHSPITMQEEMSSLYNNMAATVGLHPMDYRARTSSLDRRHPRDYSTPGEYRGQRSHNLSESTSYNYQRGYSDDPLRYRVDGSHDLMGSHRGVVSPTEIDFQLSSGQSSRESSIRRYQGSPHHHHGNHPLYPSNQHGVDNAPVRGSGRRGNRPERGSGRYQTTPHYSSSSSNSVSPSVSLVAPDTHGPVTNGYATLPRSGSRSSEQEMLQTAAETTSLCSLDNLRLSDSEVNEAFDRNQPGRISITKKTKKDPRKDFVHLKLDNVEPLVEGEAPVLMRTGSDGCLNESANEAMLQHSVAGLTLGPQLGLVKSSSLESLHNVMSHSIKRDLVDDTSRPNRTDYRKAMDQSPQDTPPQQRSVDANFDLEDSNSVPALMSFTKNPNTRKGKKSSFLKKFGLGSKKKTKGKKERPASISTPTSLHSRGHSVDRILDQENFSEAEKELLRTGFSIPVRLGDDSGDIKIPGDSRYGNPEPQRHSMPLLDDYDSPASPTDEALLSTMAKV